MKDKASDLGCTAGDMACLCKSEDFAWGIRDCTTQACPNANASQVVAEALNSCSSM